MDAHNYDFNGYYTSSTPATPDPVTNPSGDPAGEFLLPAHATFTAPPTFGSGQRPKWTGSGWVLGTDPTILARQFVVFYRIELNLDTKVLGGALFGTCAPDGNTILFNGLPLSDPSNSKVGACTFDSEAAATGWDSKNANGVALKCIVSDALADRDPTAVAKDADNAAAIEAECEQQIYNILYNIANTEMDQTTHIMLCIEALYTATNVSGLETQQNIDGAKALLSTYRNIFTEIQAARATRDAALAALDPA